MGVAACVRASWEMKERAQRPRGPLDSGLSVLTGNNPSLWTGKRHAAGSSKLVNELSSEPSESSQVIHRVDQPVGG